MSAYFIFQIKIMMRRLLLIPVLALFMVLGGCNKAASLDSLAPAGSVEAAKHYVALIQSKQFDVLEQRFGDNASTPKIQAALTQMAALIPPQSPVSVKVVGVRTSNVTTDGKSTAATSITLEYQFSHQWLLASVITQPSAQGPSLLSINLTPMADSLENTHAFTLAGKGPSHFMMLALAILIPVFIVYALVCCAKAKLAKHKALWILFILFGFGQVTLNWTTGQWMLNPLSFQLLGAGAFAPLFGPWAISVSLPLGAIAFLLKRKSLTKAKA
jgi:hypothetical protein